MTTAKIWKLHIMTAVKIYKNIYMKILSLKEAFDLIQEAAAVIVNEDAIIYPSLSELTGENDNELAAFVLGG